jgi:Stress responsive A/B Barrel Domain
MIRHIVLLRFNDDAEEAAIDRYVEAVKQLPALIPSIVDFDCGRDIGKDRDLELASNWDFVTSATFSNFADYLGYLKHPEHLALVERHVVGLMSDRAALQIEEGDGPLWAGHPR